MISHPNLTARFRREDFHRPTLTVARLLLGCLLVHRISPTDIRLGRIVETEAYLGPHDRAAHSFRDRRTARNAPMFGPKGHTYVYFIYGMHWCVNVVTGPESKPQAVLIRALEWIDWPSEQITPHASTARGPGKLCKALGITGELNNHCLITSNIFIVPKRRRRGERIIATPRIGIRYAENYAAKPWRFCIADNPSVSGPRIKIARRDPSWDASAT